MKYLKNLLILLAFAGPIYQLADSAIKNSEGDGKEIYGDNPVFRKILGVRTDYYDFFEGHGWEHRYYSVRTPLWMQNLLKTQKVVYYGGDESSKLYDQIIVFITRFCIKFIYFFGLLYLSQIIKPKE